MQISPVQPIFRPNPPGRDLGLLVPFCRVLLHLIVKTGFMSLKYFLNLHHFSSISRRLSVNARHFLNKHWTFLEKSRTFLRKRGRFSEKRWTFFAKRRRLSSAIERLHPELLQKAPGFFSKAQELFSKAQDLFTKAMIKNT